jgi:hydrogenase expression/formation protein HypC
MCLAIPGKVLEIKVSVAKVDFGNGVTRNVDVSLIDVDVGQYVLVHTGYAIQVMEEEDALGTLDLWREIMDSLNSASREKSRE